MKARILLMGCVLVASLPAWGQTSQPATAPATAQPSETAAPAGSWVGVLTGTSVYVRSGPGEQAYPCSRLSAPDTVTVVGKTDSWLKILPPPGCFSVISKQYVQADADGKTGTLTGDNVWIRAGGDLRNSDFWAFQRRASKGEKVQITGEVGDYYKIVPPSDVYFYISARYVRSQNEAAAAETAEKPGELTVVPETSTRAPADKASSLSTAGVPANAQEAFNAAEKALKAEFAKPLEQRDLKALLAQYQAITAEEPLKKYVNNRINYLQSKIAEMEDLENVKKMAQDIVAKQAEYEKKRSEIQKEFPPEPTVRTYAAKGVIGKSDVFSGNTAAISKRYIVVDPQTKQVTAYVMSGNDAVNLDNYVGMNVGIFGAKHFDRNLLRYIVLAEEIVVLGVSEGIPTPPKPTIVIEKPTTQPKTVVPPLPTEGRLETQPASQPATMPATGLPTAGEERPAGEKVDETEYK